MIFIVLPAFNEEKKIGRVIRDLFEHGYKNIVVVDDGSSDETAKQAELSGAVVLRHRVNRGQGAALQTGNEFALESGAKIVVHFDADGQFNSKDLDCAIARMHSNSLDVILGSRFLDKRSNIPFFKNFILLPFSRLINNFLTGLKVSDVHNGFRVLNHRAAQKIIITQDGMAHNSQIPRLIKEHNLSYEEYPVEVFYDESGQGVAGGFKILYDLLIDKISQ
ncbi:MAG: glycosyltransferase family 2 protein [Candidatus Magasanikbacteria bacterium]|nr:glycosyltransferase family 2 protein [Candidatus Magasanikbacteria bacterium]